jgi:iron complex outermembrane receptor protein
MGHSLLDGENITLSARYVNTGKLFFNGFFAQGVWRYKDMLSLNVGFRLDAFDGMADPALTPRVGLIYHPVEKLSLKLLYGRSFLAPQWAHQETSTDINQDFQSNPDLQPETFDGLDLIVDYSFNKLNVYIDGFYNKVSEIISAQGPKYGNQGEAQYAGVEAGFKASLFDKVKIDGSISYVDNFEADSNYQNANYTDGELRGVAPVIGRYGIEYSPVEHLFILVWGRTYSEVTAFNPPNDNKIDPWTAIDAAINYSIMNVDLQLQVLNVADAEYLIADNNGGRRPLPRYGRGFHASVGYKF